MRKITVTYDIVYSLERDYEITDEQFTELCGTGDLYDVLGDKAIEELHYDTWRKGDLESDFRVVDEYDMEIISPVLGIRSFH